MSCLMEFIWVSFARSGTHTHTHSWHQLAVFSGSRFGVPGAHAQRRDRQRLCPAPLLGWRTDMKQRASCYGCSFVLFLQFGWSFDCFGGFRRWPEGRAAGRPSRVSWRRSHQGHSDQYMAQELKRYCLAFILKNFDQAGEPSQRQFHEETQNKDGNNLLGVHGS